MSEELQSLPDKNSHNVRTILFMVVLSFVCALVLSLLASALAEPQEIAKDLDRSKQMMIAAKMLDHQGYFLMEDEQGKMVPAKYSHGVLVPGTINDLATNAQILELYQKRIKPFLIDDKGNITTFEKARINREEYLSSYRKTGYYLQPYKLIYAIYRNIPMIDQNAQAEAYVIPVNGFGLWDAIYGYISIKSDGNHVVGISWYDQKETPGLGANISEAYWQNLFPGKQIFQESPDGQTNFKTAPLGIIVVKGKVAEVLGDSPKAKSAVDGMAGATLTGNGVTDAYKNVLAAYRPFLVQLQEKYSKK